jgi:hypothetical protein
MKTRLAACLVTVLCWSGVSLAQEDPKPGFNLFSVEQDIEIGRQSAAEAERQLPILRDQALERYVNAVTRELTSNTPGPRYPYRVRVVNASDINAFALPGGFLYVNRGLLEATRSESELAGVLAHEISHVALRHGTHEASKAYAAQAGIGILGGLLGRDRSSNTNAVINAVGGVGLNAVFLKFSRNDEYQADLLGVRTMSRAGYDPSAMVSFFELLSRERAREPGKLEQFFSSHPAPADRATRMRAEADRLGPVDRPKEVGGFAGIRQALRGLPEPDRQQRRLGETRRVEPDTGAGSVRAGRATLDPPSPRLRTFRQRDGFFDIDYPENWRAYEPERGYGAVIAPDGGIRVSGARSEGIVCALVINHYDPFDDGGSTLEEATEDVVAQVLRGNSYLRRQGRARRETVGGRRGLAVELSGRSPVTGESERVSVLTRALSDGHVLYALVVTPGSEASRFAPAFDRMIDSLRIDDRSAHR